MENENTNSLMELKSQLPVSVDGKGAGFECMDANDLIASRVSIVQPASQTEVAQGEFYDVNTDTSLGKEIKFFFMSKRTTHFQGKDMTTGEPKMIEKKEILAMPEVIDFPMIISLSATGYWPLSNLMTKLFKAYGKNGYPVFTGLIKATTEIVMNEKGKYYIPKFGFIRHATKEEMAQLIAFYKEMVPMFREGSVDSPTPSKAPFEEPKGTGEYVDNVARALDIDNVAMAKASKPDTLSIDEINAEAAKKSSIKDDFPDIKI